MEKSLEQLPISCYFNGKGKVKRLNWFTHKGNKEKSLWTFIKRVKIRNVGNHYNDFFSDLCRNVPKHLKKELRIQIKQRSEQFIYHEEDKETNLLAETRYFHLDDNCIIRRTKKAKKHKVKEFCSFDFDIEISWKINKKEPNKAPIYEYKTGNLTEFLKDMREQRLISYYRTDKKIHYIDLSLLTDVKLLSGNILKFCDFKSKEFKKARAEYLKNPDLVQKLKIYKSFQQMSRTSWHLYN